LQRPETARDYLRLRRGILTHVLDGDVSWFDASVFIWLALEASASSGIVRTCAPNIANQYRLSVHRVRKTFRRLRNKIGWIYYDERQGHRGVFPVGIYKYPLPDGVYTPSREEWSEALTRSSLAPQEGGDWTKVWILLVATWRKSENEQSQSKGTSGGESSESPEPTEMTGPSVHPAVGSGTSSGASEDQSPDHDPAHRSYEEEEVPQGGGVPRISETGSQLGDRILGGLKEQYSEHYPAPLPYSVRWGPKQMGSLLSYAHETSRLSGCPNPSEEVVDGFLQDCFTAYLRDGCAFNRKVNHRFSTFVENIGQYANQILEEQSA